jgi:hypothetical protein
VRKVSLRLDKKKNTYVARKRLPADVREEYERRYDAGSEAVLRSAASKGKAVALERFAKWEVEVNQRIDLIRKEQRGEGINLDFKQAVALAAEWYRWFVAKYEDNPGDPEAYETALWNVVDEMREFAPEEIRAQPLDGNMDWADDPEVREGIRPLIADLGQTSQFLAHRGIVLSNAARGLFLDRVISELQAALVTLESRARGDYSPDNRHDTTHPSHPVIRLSRPA